MKSAYDVRSPAACPTFDWMGKEMLIALTYLLTVIQSIQTCQIDRTHKYHAVAMRHIGEMRRLMAKSNWPLVRRGALDLLNVFEIILYENIAAAQLILARPLDTINVLGAMMEKMRQSIDLFNQAHKYHAVAMRHIGEMRRLMAKSNWPLVRRGALDLLNVFEIILYENIAAAQLILARPLDTINVVSLQLSQLSCHIYTQQ
ncbi:unnamed protein product [Gongylonema pulchrum]|uniref:NR LBD domain-containing protein n=1 Tax=Gongylonema pulchrum TaxID=637853 RepID=A0A183EPA7_9BILA|nr:unnamed protein product [Gongylonema pulchrum]